MYYPHEDFKEKYGEKLGTWLFEQLVDLEVEYQDECADNFRWADMSSPKELYEYEIIKDEGCCGSEDREVVYPETGRKFMIGCNYGH